MNRIDENDRKFLEQAIELSRKGMEQGSGGPFGCVVVRNGEVIGEGCNSVLSDNDPTAHAEIVAIRQACRKLNSFQLNDCDLYASCEPCPMCLGAIYWARPKRVIYANTRFDAAVIQFDDDFIYQQMNANILQRKIPFIHYPHPLAAKVFDDWKRMEHKKLY
jgi:tRNA(Arg) A34 adenosine deaminase TadA